MMAMAQTNAGSDTNSADNPFAALTQNVDMNSLMADLDKMMKGLPQTQNPAGPAGPAPDATIQAQQNTSAMNATAAAVASTSDNASKQSPTEDDMDAMLRDALSQLNVDADGKSNTGMPPMPDMAEMMRALGDDPLASALFSGANAQGDQVC
jgi:uncharacterized protein with von Willebrand factor type A (vWA) domain